MVINFCLPLKKPHLFDFIGLEQINNEYRKSRDINLPSCMQAETARLIADCH